MGKKGSIYIDKSLLDSLIINLGRELWEERFSCTPLYSVGNQERCNIKVDDNEQKLDFYFRMDGTVTIKPVGKNTDYSEKLKNAIIDNSFDTKCINSNCTFNNVSEKYYNLLLNYISNLENVKVEEDREIEIPKHRHIKYSSTFGDKMVINRYETGTVLFQGNPAFILTQAMYFMSLNSEISEEEISRNQKKLYKTKLISISEARNKLKIKLPNAYDKLDNIILKILSPSISLSYSNLGIDEYSCYVFPALKALEAFLLNLLNDKNIVISQKIGFGSIFGYDEDNFLYKIKSKYKYLINDDDYIECIEVIYNYLNQVRHKYFHANQILVLTSLIHDKEEADEIIKDVLEIIDNTAKKIM